MPFESEVDAPGVRQGGLVLLDDYYAGVVAVEAFAGLEDEAEVVAEVVGDVEFGRYDGLRFVWIGEFEGCAGELVHFEPVNAEGGVYHKPAEVHLGTGIRP